jgi:hypothetical protein
MKTRGRKVRDRRHRKQITALSHPQITRIINGLEIVLIKMSLRILRPSFHLRCNFGGTGRINSVKQSSAKHCPKSNEGSPLDTKDPSIRLRQPQDDLLCK